MLFMIINVKLNTQVYIESLVICTKSLIVGANIKWNKQCKPNMESDVYSPSILPYIPWKGYKWMTGVITKSVAHKGDF